MFLDSWIAYLKPSNASRITGLSLHDPFAIAGFIMLLLLVPIALVLVTVTARQSAESVWDDVRIDAMFRPPCPHRSRLSAAEDVPWQSDARQSQRSDRATREICVVSFADVIDVPRTPCTPQTPGTPRLPSILRISRKMDAPEDSLDEIPLLPPSPDRPQVKAVPTPQASDLSLPDEYDFIDVYTHDSRIQQAPRLDVTADDLEARRRWTEEMHDSLREVSAVEMV
ncbi:hypothetical protein LTR53_006148 [Teratosphaeriaceae sp. CCFEE 6253]|nr:hypothetical protein LTR53_006148 [Teratosphaeriaceae sp. CCFEE 6253]